ncbi:MAG TPA: hypothetical protein VMB24_04350 [Dehalococcoidales bacterium]|nr:hypothetical protein [Dehalococcoidales bacterium]
MIEVATIDQTMSKVDEISHTYDSDPGHNKQVTDIALSFFDALIPLHQYGESERRLLEIASRLHDIGWSMTVLQKHHKLSGKLIMRLDIPGLDKTDRMMCALIARYHTKSLPDASRHKKFAALDGRCRDIVEWLAAILRVSDALDSSHTSVVKRIKIEINDDALVVHLITNGDCWDEIRRVRRKQDLLLKKTGKVIIYQC